MVSQVNIPFPVIGSRKVSRPRWRYQGASIALMAAVLLSMNACGGGNAASRPPAPAVSLSIGNLDFGSWRASTTSQPLTLTITNSGTLALMITNIALGGANAAAFTLKNNCGSSLAPGSGCNVSVTFSPATTASMSASLTISDNAADSPQTVGLSGLGSSVSGVAHGVFVFDPPSSDDQCFQPLPGNCYSSHLVPTLICSGNGTPTGYGCDGQGAGWPFVEGAVFQVLWSSISTGNGSFDFSGVTSRMQPWTDSGKLVSLVFLPTSFGGTNNATPSWYLNPVPISAVSQTGGIVQVQSSSGFGFLPGMLSNAAGLELQITGTGTALDTTSTNPGIWVICDHTTAGCQDPTAQTIFAIGSGPDIAAVHTGMVGNPVYGSSDGSVCTSGILPIEWRPNFVKAWQDVIAHAIAQYGGNNNIAYMRFGMGIGGQTEPTNGLSSFDVNPAACQAQMTKFSFTSTSAPWPNPGDPGWSAVSQTWVSYLQNMVQFEAHQNSPKALILTLSPIIFAPEDVSTIDTMAQSAAASGIGIGNQGLDKNDPQNFPHCFGADWCENFPKYVNQVSTTEQQTLSDSDPTNSDPNNNTGSLAGPPNLLTFATSHDTKALELYFDDWMCTYDQGWSGANHNTFSACSSAGYPAAVSAAAAQIN